MHDHARAVSDRPGAGRAQPAALHTWTAIPTSPLSARNGAVGGWVGDRFVVVGGYEDPPCLGDCAGPAESPALRDGATFDPERGSWTAISRAPEPVDGVSVVVENRLYVLTTGYENNRRPSTLLRYDPATDRWQWLRRPSRAGWFTLVPAGSKLLAISGSDEDGSTPDQVFDPGSGRWRALPDDPLEPTFDRFAVWAGDRLVLSAKSIADLEVSAGPTLVRLAYLDDDLRTWRRGPRSETIGHIPVCRRAGWCGRVWGPPTAAR